MTKTIEETKLTARDIYIKYYLTDQFHQVWKEVQKIDPLAVPEKYRLNKNSDVEAMEFLSNIGLTFDQFDTASFRKEMLVDRIHSGFSVLGYIKRQNMMTAELPLTIYVSKMIERYELLTREKLDPANGDEIVQKMKDKNFI